MYVVSGVSPCGRWVEGKSPWLGMPVLKVPRPWVPPLSPQRTAIATFRSQCFSCHGWYQSRTCLAHRFIPRFRSEWHLQLSHPYTFSASAVLSLGSRVAPDCADTPAHPSGPRCARPARCPSRRACRRRRTRMAPRSCSTTAAATAMTCSGPPPGCTRLPAPRCKSISCIVMIEQLHQCSCIRAPQNERRRQSHDQA